MRARTAKEDISVWTSFTDAVLCFLLIVLMVFIANIIHLQRTLSEKEALAAFAEAALKDKQALIGSLLKDKDLSGMVVTSVSQSNGSGAAQDTVIVFSRDLTWQVNNHYLITQLDPNAVRTVDKFGAKLKEFLDHSDTKNPDMIRYQTYTVMIIGHANTDGNEYENYTLSQRRADSIRNHLFQTVFKGENDKDKYKILACGYGDKHLIRHFDKGKGDRCIEIVFKYDEMDMIKGNK